MMLYIFDKDSTLIKSKSGQKFINSVEDQELIPGVKEKIDQLKANGHKIAIAFNQGGVAFGYMSLDDAFGIIDHAAKLVGADYATFCSYHPGGTVEAFKVDSPYRKPNPGMIFECIGELVGGYSVDKNDIVFIGDRPEDQEVARRVGVQFEWAANFFEVLKCQNCNKHKPVNEMYSVDACSESCQDEIGY